jgi:hypothetical protein
MLDMGAHRRLGGVGAGHALRHRLALRLATMDAADLADPGEEALVLRRAIGTVRPTRIASNIAPLTAGRLAELAVQSVEAVKGGQLGPGKDGISYLRDATKNGIRTKLSEKYIDAILKLMDSHSLDEAIAKYT